jgi:Flp pilus assembly protein TadD
MNDAAGSARTRDHHSIVFISSALSRRELAVRGCHLGGVVAYEHALTITPTDAATCNNMAVASIAASNLGEAVAAYGRALAIHPRYILAWKTKAVDPRRAGRDAEAQEAEQRARREA